MAEFPTAKPPTAKLPTTDSPAEPPEPPVAPHLSRPELRPIRADESETFMRAVWDGFHEAINPDALAAEMATFEPERSFGFAAGDRWLSTFGAFTRSLVVPGGADLPVAAVTQVTVHPSYRRRGLLTRMMAHQFADARRRREAAAVLWASESLIYGRFGYGLAVPRLRLTGQTRSTGFVPEAPADDGSVGEVTRAQFLAAAPALRDRIRPQQPGWLDRTATWWESELQDYESARQGATPLRYLLHHAADGAVDGYASYRVKGDYDANGPQGEVRIGELDAATPAGYAALWRHLLDLDLVRKFAARNVPMDAAILHLVADPGVLQAARLDSLFVRLLDVPRALAARRYAVDIDIVLEVVDPMVEANQGRLHLTGGREAATVRRVRRVPDLTLSVRELGASYLGGTSLAALHRAGLVTEHRRGAVARASAAFGWDRAPWCTDHF